MNFKTILLTTITLLILISSCNKEEGEGGKSTIRGTMYSICYNDNDDILDTIPAVAEDVYIVYGKSGFSDDDMETNYDGTYEFKYLRKGDYQIFAYSRDWIGECSIIPVIKNVHLSNNETINVEPIYIYSSKEGSASITGKVKVRDLVKGTLNQEVVPAFYCGDIRVYLQRFGTDVVLDDTRTSWNGTYKFSRLFPGKYIVYAYSEDVLNGSEQLFPVMDTVEINEYNQQISLKDILIIK